jgi:hypothetical protein
MSKNVVKTEGATNVVKTEGATNVVKTEGATNVVTTWRICFALWISNDTRKHTPTHPGTHASSLTQTQTNMSYLLLFHGNCYANASQCYVIRTLPALLITSNSEEAGSSEV